MSRLAESVRSSLEAGSRPATIGDTVVVGAYGDPVEEYRTLTSVGGLIARSYRGLIEVTGSDRASWLHNLTTNQVKTLHGGQGNYAFALNVQGRILFDLVVSIREESIWLDLDQRYLSSALRHLSKYIITEEVALKDRSAEFERLAMAGPAASKALQNLGLSNAAALSLFDSASLSWDGVSVPVVRTDFCGLKAFELFVPSPRGGDAFNAFTSPGQARLTPIGADAVEVCRIEAGCPWPGAEITDDVVPAETGLLDRAVSFVKGCYLGQEVVERMRTRKIVARRLVGLRIEGTGIADRGDSLAASDGGKVGGVTSSCHSIALNAAVALGYVRVGQSNPGTLLTIVGREGPRAAIVCALPFASFGS